MSPKFISKKREFRKIGVGIFEVLLYFANETNTLLIRQSLSGLLLSLLFVSDIVEIPEESDTDSEFDERMESVINEVPIIDENIRQETAAKILASNR